MNKFKSKEVVCLFMLFWIFVPKDLVFSQTKNELEERKKNLSQEIVLANKLLNEVQQKEKNSINEYNLNAEKIYIRNKYIKEIDTQISLLNIKIVKNKENIDSLNLELKNIREEYAVLIFIAYKNRFSGNPLMFILAANTVNQAYKRIKYIQEYSKYRKDQVSKQD